MKHLENDRGEVVIDPLVLYEKNLSGVDINRDILCCVLDVETTHLKPQAGNVIQIAVLPFFCNKETGEVTGIQDTSMKLQQPDEPLTDEIKELTGLTDEVLHGHKIDWEKVSGLISKCSLIIAHNASFDRKWIESELKKADIKMPDTPWSCTLSDVDWKNTMYPSRSLSVLCAWHGFRYDAHNAVNDVCAVLQLIERSSIMLNLIEAATQNSYRVYASGSLFEEKSLLKERSYRWDSEARCWWRSLENSDEVEAETAWIKEHLSCVTPTVLEISASQRFS